MERFRGDVCRVIRRDSIKLLFSAISSPKVLVPPMPADPLTGLERLGFALNSGKTLVYRICVTVNLLMI